MKIHRVDQGTPEWKKVRIGIPTSSWFHTIITPTGKPTDNRERKKYIYRLVSERILRQPMPDNFVSSWMERGSDLEAPAVRAFLKRNPVELAEGGFVTDDKIRVGCSPDRLIMERKRATCGLEVKVPSPWVHLGNLVDGPGDKYKPQVQGQLWIAEFEAVHFWSWNPNLPEKHVVTLRDDKYIRTLETLVGLFLEEVDQTEDYVRRQGPVAEMAEMPLNGHFPWSDP